MTKKTITVEELRNQLNNLIELGFANAEIWYRDSDSMDWEIKTGIWDTTEDDGEKFVALA